MEPAKHPYITIEVRVPLDLHNLRHDENVAADIGAAAQEYANETYGRAPAPEEERSRHMETLDTATLSLGRFTPMTPAQRAQALEGIAQCDRDWSAGELTTGDDMIRQGRGAHWRAGYQVRWLEHSATLPCPARYPVHARYPGRRPHARGLAD